MRTATGMIVAGIDVPAATLMPQLPCNDKCTKTSLMKGNPRRQLGKPVPTLVQGPRSESRSGGGSGSGLRSGSGSGLRLRGYKT